LGRGLRAIGLALALIALFCARPAHADVQQLVARLLLIPQSPGAQVNAPDVFAAEAVPPASFDIYLDPELGGQDVDAYLTDRRLLLSSRYAVWLYRFDDDTALGKQGLAGPTLVIEADSSGSFPLSGPAITPGKLYAWQVVATVTDTAGSTVQVWSAPLYFRTMPAESSFPAVLDPVLNTALRELTHLASEQQRARAALQASLRGLPPYTNCPSSSDRYLAIPTTGGDTCPRPDAAAGWRLSLPQLIALGKSVAHLQPDRSGMAASPADLSSAGAALYSNMQQWTDSASAPPPKEFAALVEVTNRMRNLAVGVDEQQAAALFSEFVVSADAVAASGTLNVHTSYEQAFLAYALATQERLAQARQLKAALEPALGQQETAAWLGAFTGASQQLSAIASEVQRGRLGKTQLIARLAKLTPPVPAGEHEAAHYLEANGCRVDLERIKRLTAADAPQIVQLSAELARCHLQRLAGSVWP
jgi:hypothetical protein